MITSAHACMMNIMTVVFEINIIVLKMQLLSLTTFFPSSFDFFDVDIK